jgi:hypothetical protein
MLKVNFNSYASYVTDSLYQWDINQDLNISGINLSVNPEIHFNNANMDRAIVRQGTLENGSIKVKIPNSLLQYALPIKAYVGIYEGDTFKVIESLEIPVIGRQKPFDYSLTDADEEIYSFKALENLFRTTVKEVEDLVDISNENAKASADSAKASAESAEQARRESANAVTEALNLAILKSDIVEIVKVTSLPENPSENVLYVLV